jgi:hypothetical protein
VMLDVITEVDAGSVRISVFVIVSTGPAGKVIVVISYEVVCSTEVRVIVAPGRVVVWKIVVGAKVLVDVDVYADVMIRVRVSVTALNTLAIFRHREVLLEARSRNISTGSNDRCRRRHSDDTTNSTLSCFKRFSDCER